VVVLSTNEPRRVGGTLRVNANGVGRYDKISPWKEPSPDLFSKPGRYKVHVAFKDKDGKHGLETKKHRFEVVDGKDQLPETKLTELAKQYVMELEGVDTLLAPWYLPVSDTEGNVVFRLSVE